MTIRVRAPSRLHFGLLALGGGGRHFGGAGLMIEHPGVDVTATYDKELTIVGAVDETAHRRVAEIVPLVQESFQLPPQPVRIEIVRGAPEHHGLGVGTQLSLAAALAVCRLAGVAPTAPELAAVTGRGRRSAIGVHGFAQGGFLVDGGKTHPEHLAPLVARRRLPHDWTVLVIQPDSPAGLSGEAEQRLMDELVIPETTTGRLSRLLLLGVLPALVEEDYPAFAESLFEYNATAGDCFAGVQHGPYAHRRVGELVQSLRRWSCPAAGQSSWGPTVFAIASDPERAAWLAEQTCKSFGFDERRVVMTAANNSGARCLEA